MPVEMRGENQLRISVRSKRSFADYRTDDIGRPGYLQRIAGHRGKKWLTQSWVMNLRDYNTLQGIYKDIDYLRVNESKKRQAKKFAYIWWKKHR